MLIKTTHIGTKLNNILTRAALVWILVVVCFPAYATDVASGVFSFSLPGDWQLINEQSGAVRAQKRIDDSFRAFIISVYHPPTVKEGGEMLVYIQQYLEGLSKGTDDLKKETEYTEYKSTRGAPFHHIAYSYTKHNGFLIGASLGSNAGVVLITYEGDGSYNGALNELQMILDTMQIHSLNE